MKMETREWEGHLGSYCDTVQPTGSIYDLSIMTSKSRKKKKTWWVCFDKIKVFFSRIKGYFQFEKDVIIKLPYMGKNEYNGNESILMRQILT
jgi:hypothetical protein